MEDRLRASRPAAPVTFHFRGTPNYQESDSDVYQIPIIPRHVWSLYSATEITTGNTDTGRR